MAADAMLRQFVAMDNAATWHSQRLGISAIVTARIGDATLHMDTTDSLSGASTLFAFGSNEQTTARDDGVLQNCKQMISIGYHTR
jgi:hypothetical protein